MRRLIQIGSAYALLLAVAGPVTGFSDSFAAEGDNLPCNNFCRTWMGYENSQGTAPPASPTEAVSAKPVEVRDPQAPTDDAASSSASQTKVKSSHPKPKSKVGPETADGSDHRSVETRSKTGKLAKRHRKNDDVVSDTKSDSGSSTKPPTSQAEEGLGSRPTDHNETASEPATVALRDVPLPPRLPRGARSKRTGVAQAGSKATDDLRADAANGQPSRSAASQTATRNLTPAAPPAPQADVPGPALRSIAASPSTTADKGSTGVGGDRVTASPPQSATLNVTPAVDPRKDAPQTLPPAADARRPDRSEAGPNRMPVDSTTVVRPAPPAGHSAPSASDPEDVAVRTEALPPTATAPATTLSKEAVEPSTPNAIDKAPAFVVQGAKASEPSAPEEQAVTAGSGPDKNAQQVVALPQAPAPPMTVSREEAARQRPDAAENKPADPVDNAAASGLSSPGGQAVSSPSAVMAVQR